MDQELLAQELLHLKKRERAVWIVLLCVVVGFGCLFGGQSWYLYTLGHRDTLTLRRLDIVDAHGVPRVILAAPAPRAMRDGKIVGREREIAGILIYDATGTERGGYVTADGYANAMLTLDAPGKQTVLLLAEPDGSTLFRVWNADKGSLVMGVSSENPFLNVNQNGKTVFSAPAKNPEANDPRPLFR